MSDLRELFRGLGDDVAALPRPSPQELRHTAERHRTRRRLSTGAAGAVMLVLISVGLYSAGNDPPSRLVVAPPAASPARPAPPAGESDRTWLGEPWVLQSARSSTWPAGTASSYAFCGRPYVPNWPVHVREQRLVHPSGRRAQLLELSPETEGPMQLFKWSYSACLVAGQAEGIGGPRNVWSYGAVAAGSEPVGRTLHVVEITGPSAEEHASRRDVEAVMDAWRP